MKQLIYILAIFTLLLAVVPCCMFDHCGQDEVQKEHAATPKDEGYCSPFASCGTCCGFVYHITVVSLEIKPIVLSMFYPAYNQKYLSTYSLSIWQSPKQV